MLNSEEIKKMNELIASGYAGISSDGKIVDRRKEKTARPIPKNKLLNVPEPKEIK